MKLDKSISPIHLALAFSFLYGVNLLFASFISSPYIWGIRVFEFISFSAASLVLFFLIAPFIPAVRQALISTVDGAVRSIQSQRKIVRYIIFCVGVIILIVLLWSFRQSLYFLGDGYLLIGSLENINLYSDIHIFYKNEPLPGLIIVTVDRLLLTLNHDSTAVTSIQVVSVLFGVGSIVLAYKIIKQCTNDVSSALIATICFLTAATTQLYFGYVENYSPVIFFLLMFLFSSLRFLQTKEYFVLVILNYTLLFFSHYSMLCLFPAFIFLSYIMLKNKKIVEFALSVFLGGIILAILIKITYSRFDIFFERFLSSSNHFLPLTSSENISFSYSLFSIHHITDVLNHYLFVFPFLLPIGLLLLFYIRRSKIWTDPTMFFFILTSLSAAVFGFTVKSDLGLSRDWDLFALFLVPAILFVIIGITKMVPQEQQKHIFVIITLMTFAHTGPLIYINSNAEQAFKYFISLPNDQLWSKKSNANAHDDLARYFEKQQNYERSLFHYQQYLKYDPTNSRILENIGGTYFYVFKDSVNAQKAYEKCVEYGRQSWVVFGNLGEIYLNQQRYDSALVLLTQSLELKPNNDLAKHYKEITLARMGRK